MVSLTCCDGPCCGSTLAAELAPLAELARFEVATCLSECDRAPVVRVRFDDNDGRRTTALLSGAGSPALATDLRSWIERGAPAPLPSELRIAEFLPGEGGGCLCDEDPAPLAD